MTPEDFEKYSAELLRRISQSQLLSEGSSKFSTYHDFLVWRFEAPTNGQHWACELVISENEIMNNSWWASHHANRVYRAFNNHRLGTI